MADLITVLLVDDRAVVRRGVRAFLETQPGIVVVADAASWEAAIRLAVEHAPDVALVDAARVVRELHGPRGDDLNPFRELSDRELGVLRLIADG